MKEALIKNGEGLSPGRCPVGEQCRPSCHQTTVRKKWAKDDNKFAINCYLKAKEGQREYRKRMHQYCREECRFEIEEHRE